MRITTTARGEEGEIVRGRPTALQNKAVQYGRDILTHWTEAVEEFSVQGRSLA